MIQTVKGQDNFQNVIHIGGFHRFNKLILLYLKLLSSIKLKVFDGPNFCGL